MVELENYAEYGGDHWELGALRNVLAHQGERMPHDGNPPSEALLLGIAGGIVAGYFIFQYQGYPPLFNFLTVNSFDPLTNVLERLQIEVNNLRTNSAEKARLNLTQAMANGKAPLVWADAFSLGYGDSQWGDENWFVIPILVTRYDEASDEATIVDRANVPIEIPAHQLDAARQRIRKERQRVMTLGKINLEQLPGAICEGILQCLDHAMGEPPRKPMRGKYGLAAYTRWADVLSDERSKTGWKRQFTKGSERFALITNFYHYTHHFGTGGMGARGRYADFLVEAAAILEQDDLRSAAPAFRQAEQLWKALYEEMLSTDYPPLSHARKLMDDRERMFRDRGLASTEERKIINAQLETLRVEADETLDFSDSEERRWRLGLREAVLAIQEQETLAFQQLQEAMATMEV